MIITAETRHHTEKGALKAFQQKHACASACQPCAQVCLGKGTRAQLWTLAASTHLPATAADRSGKNMPGIMLSSHTCFYPN